MTVLEQLFLALCWHCIAHLLDSSRLCLPLTFTRPTPKGNAAKKTVDADVIATAIRSPWQQGSIGVGCAVRSTLRTIAIILTMKSLFRVKTQRTE